MLEQKNTYERIIISACLQNYDNYNVIKSRGISKEFFYNDAYRKIWEKIDEVALEKGISPLIITDSFNCRSEKERDAKLKALEKMKSEEIAEGDLEHSISTVKKNYTCESLRNISVGVLDSLTSKEDTNAIINNLMDKIFSLDVDNTDIIEYNALQAVDETRKELNMRLNGEVEDGVPSGIRTIDEQIRCFYYSLYSIIIGRPGHGKTTLMINCFLNNLLADYKPVFFSLEMPAVHLIVKMLGIMTKVSVNKIMDPSRLSGEEMNKVKEALVELSKHEFYIVDAVSMNVLELGVCLYKYKKLGCKISYLDYIQLLKLNDNKTPNDAGEFREISKSVRETIRRVNRFGNMALVVGAQAGRSVETRPVEDRVPTQKDLEWSSSLEQDAAVIIGLMNREKYEGDDCEYKNQIFLGFPKHRYEYAKKVSVAFLGDIQYITDLCTEDIYNQKIDNWQRQVEKEKKQRELEENQNKQQSDINQPDPFEPNKVTNELTSNNIEDVSLQDLVNSTDFSKIEEPKEDKEVVEEKVKEVVDDTNKYDKFEVIDWDSVDKEVKSTVE